MITIAPSKHTVTQLLEVIGDANHVIFEHRSLFGRFGVLQSLPASVTHLTIRGQGTGDFEEIDLRDLSKLSHLRGLELIGPELMVLADSFTYLPTTLTELTIKWITVANAAKGDHQAEALKALGRLTSLRSFTILGNELDVYTASVVGSMSALEALDMDLATDTLLPALGALTGLRYLRLSRYRECEAGRLFAALPAGLTRLDLRGAEFAFDVARLAALPSLTHLDLRECANIHGDLIDVGSLTSLTSLSSLEA